MKVGFLRRQTRMTDRIVFAKAAIFEGVDLATLLVLHKQRLLAQLNARLTRLHAVALQTLDLAVKQWARRRQESGQRRENAEKTAERGRERRKKEIGGERERERP